MKRSLAILSLLLCVAPIPRGLAAPADDYQTLLREYQAAQREFNQLYRAARTAEERLDAQVKNPLNPFIDRFLALAKAHPQDGAALDALSWIAVNGEAGPGFNEAFAILATQHADSPRLTPQILEAMAEYTQEGDKHLRTIIAKSPHREVQGYARYYLAHRLKLDQPDAAMDLYAEIIEKYADLRGRRGTLGRSAQAEFNELDTLSPGKPAPEISGEDVDGKPFKLSDYRGKVVMLNFWGDW
jgi:hypothetical protein